MIISNFESDIDYQMIKFWRLAQLIETYINMSNNTKRSHQMAGWYVMGTWLLC